MLTPAQYEILKNWPDKGLYSIEKFALLPWMDEFIYQWHCEIDGISYPVYLKRPCECRKAIREYEEANGLIKWKVCAACGKGLKFNYSVIEEIPFCTFCAVTFLDGVARGKEEKEREDES